MTTVNYDHLHGLSVRITSGYQAGLTGTVIRTTYQSHNTFGRWVAAVELDEAPKTAVLGIGPDGLALVNVSYIEVLDGAGMSEYDDEGYASEIEHDGQPTMYEEYQDLYGGDDFVEQWDVEYEGDW